MVELHQSTSKLMTTKQSSISTLVVVDFNDVVVVTTPYSLGNVLFEYIKSNTKFDWGEIRVEFSDLNFENIKVLTKEYNNISEEPATILIEKLLLLENYNTNKTILLVIESIDDIIVKKLFYEKLLKDTLAIPSPNNLNINTIEHNNRILTEFEIYLKEYYPNILGQYLHDVISYFKMIVSWTPNNGYYILSNFDNKATELIHKYINYKSTKWIDLVYGETSYTKFIYPIYSLYSKLKSSGNNIKLLTLTDFLSSPDHLNITKDDFISLNNILNEYNVDMRLQKYISKSLNVVYKTNDYQRDLKLYKQIVDVDDVSVHIKPWCPIFIIPTNGNLVITATKIASSFLIKNYKNSNNNDNHQPLVDFDRSLFSFSLGHTSKLNTTSEEREHHNTLQKYNDIMSSSDDGVIYILYRNPFDRYIQSLYQDLSEYIREIHSTNGNDGVLNLYSTFIKNSPNDAILMKNLKQLFKQIDHTDIPVPSNLAKYFSHIDKIDDIIKNIIDGLINYFFTQGFLERDAENDIPISNIYSNTSRFNVLTPHYTPYLTNVLDLYNTSSNKLKIKFVDIDSENIINTILDKDTSNISEDEANITPVDFKKIWKAKLINYLKDNSEINQSINQALNSDLIAYKSIKNLKNNNQIQNQEFKTSYISNEVSFQLTDINNNIVITTQKIASSWLIQNYAKLNTDITEISGEFAGILNNKYRGIFSTKLNIINGAIEFAPPIESFNEKEREELTIIQNRKSTLLANILKGNHTGNIYILYRNPEYRYITAVKEDINTYLSNVNNTNPKAIINFYLSFIKDLPSESYVIYEKLIYDMENYCGNNYLGGIFNLTTYVDHRKKKSSYSHVESFYSIILNGILHWFFNGRGPSSTSAEDPFGEVELAVKNTDGHTPIIFRNYITQHYTPYLSQMLNYYNSMGQPSYIHFLDIDTEDINDIILNKSDKDNKPNKTPDSLKDKWKLTFDKHLKSNNHVRSSISNHLMPDVIAYNNIKNIKK